MILSESCARGGVFRVLLEAFLVLMFFSFEAECWGEGHSTIDVEGTAGEAARRVREVVPSRGFGRLR
jgi:hypothetical protein